VTRLRQRAGEHELRSLIPLVTVGKTEFFRDTRQFLAFENSVFPQVLSAARAEGRPARSVAADAVAGPAQPVRGHLAASSAVGPLNGDTDGGRLRILGDVSQRLRDDMERRRLDRAGKPLVRHAVEIHRKGCSSGERLQRRAEPAASTRKNQKRSSPKNGMRSSTGTWRRRTNARASARRRQSCQNQSSINAAGTASKGRKLGAPKRMVILEGLRVLGS